MPRIAAFFGAIALIVASIGLNMVRYPVVWEMVGASTRFSQASQPAQSTAAVQPEPASQSPAMAKSTATKKPARLSASTQQEDVTARSPNAPGAHEPGKTARTAKPKGKKPVPAAHAKQTAATPVALERDKEARDTPTQDGDGEARPPASPYGMAAWEPAAMAEADGGLVPVVYPHGQSEAAASPELPTGICRLPPVDQVAPARPDHLPPYPPGGPAAIYPSTGM